MNKTALLEALSKFIAQRPGLEWGNYGDATLYRSESRSITKDRHHAETLLRYVALRDSITAEDIIKASKESFSGRLTITAEGDGFRLDYCTGQYFPTEYRRAVCAVLASAIWSRIVEDMPPSDGTKVCTSVYGGNTYEVQTYQGVQAGEYIRKQARQELGAPIARRWFN